MAYRLPYISPDPTPKAKPKKQADYLAFIRTLPCCVTGRLGVEAAHLSYRSPEYGHWGRGLSHKASDRWALPLCPEEHRIQHSGNEQRYWAQVGINPHVLALTLYGIWHEFEHLAQERAEAVIMADVRRRHD